MEFEKLYEKQISSKLIFDGVVAHLYFDEVELPDGSHSTREYIRHNGAVAVLPIDDEGNVYLVEQYRYPFSRVLTEIPAGKLDFPGEDHLSAAVRELKEETGFTADEIIPLGEFIGSPAIIGETIWLYLARSLKSGTQQLDPDEFLNVKKLSFEELCEKIANGEITDGKTVAAAFKYKLLIEKK